MASVWRHVLIKSDGMVDVLDVLSSVTATPLDAAKTRAALDYDLCKAADFVLSQTGKSMRIAYEEHEPEFVWIEIDASARLHGTLNEIAEAYKFAWGSGAGFREREESRAIFRRSLPAGYRQDRRG